ncbi:substrate-binding domain-containing protein [Caballeronia sp. LP006]|uniref:substrate-binding domain-containing protein n=1 Tax=Caballeronia sp. LP006 TaxID=3038552 RepID=UPI002864C7FD|nr:substrate-binding domain-containing protein [Caballeronia sp. LP006]MDR5827666.1 substrate-binding domain-containing protein [Caballeronia sp. LP006]
MPTPSLAPAVSMMSTLAVKSALVDVVIPAFERSSGIRVQAMFDPTNVLQERVSAGERADVLIATRAYVKRLADENVLDVPTMRGLVRTGVGVAASMRDVPRSIRSVEDLREVLLNARSVAYSKTGASGVYFATLIEEMGIAEQVNQRATIIEKGFTGECIVRGEADVAIQQMSELAMVAGIEIIGPLPEEIQFHTDFYVGMFSGRAQSEGACALLQSLFSDTERHAYERLGLTIL